MVILNIKETSLKMFVEDKEFNNYFISCAEYVGMAHENEIGDMDSIPKFEIPLADFAHGINKMHRDN